MRFVPRIVRLLALTPVALPAVAGEGRLAGPVLAEVERVVDCDTLAVRAQIWLDQDICVLMRLRGIDAPENNARCEEERRLAARANAYLAAAVSGGAVTLSAVEGGKYHGRVLADVTTAEGPMSPGHCCAPGWRGFMAGPSAARGAARAGKKPVF
jgi:micrococcal nuclease